MIQIQNNLYTTDYYFVCGMAKIARSEDQCLSVMDYIKANLNQSQIEEIQFEEMTTGLYFLIREYFAEKKIAA